MSDELDLYEWVDEIPLSRPKRNIARDFSDGVLVAEIVAHYFPRLVELHNYSSAHNKTQKLYNWDTLNQKVFKRLGFTVARADCERVVNAEPGTIEQVLEVLKLKLEQVLARSADTPTSAGSGWRAREEAHTSGGGQREELHRTSQSAAPSSRREEGVVGRLSNVALSIQRLEPAAPQRLEPAALQREPIPLTWAQPAADGRDGLVTELRDTVEILETKVQKLEQLLRLRDAKISSLMAQLGV